jgi:hypothetical protein
MACWLYYHPLRELTRLLVRYNLARKLKLFGSKKSGIQRMLILQRRLASPLTAPVRRFHWVLRSGSQPENWKPPYPDHLTVDTDYGWAIFGTRSAMAP